ncbi:MAG: hypothetical protein ACK2UW_00160 [Anaerolineales bacterium]|jgi:hypothetical protein
MQNSSQDQPLYSRTVAIQIAEISVEFLELCESERLIAVHTTRPDEPSYSAQEIRQLALLRRLNEILGIELQDLEVVLYLRSQLLDLQSEVEAMEREWFAREAQLTSEVLELRRQLAEDVDWE